MGLLLDNPFTVTVVGVPAARIGAAIAIISAFFRAKLADCRFIAGEFLAALWANEVRFFINSKWVFLQIFSACFGVFVAFVRGANALQYTPHCAVVEVVFATKILNVFTRNIVAAWIYEAKRSCQRLRRAWVFLAELNLSYAFFRLGGALFSGVNEGQFSFCRIRVFEAQLGFNVFSEIVQGQFFRLEKIVPSLFHIKRVFRRGIFKDDERKKFAAVFVPGVLQIRVAMNIFFQRIAVLGPSGRHTPSSAANVPDVGYCIQNHINARKGFLHTISLQNCIVSTLYHRREG
jgi:hypothetical protein